MATDEITQAFNEAAEARDAAGFLGTPADCIRHLSEENALLRSAKVAEVCDAVCDSYAAENQRFHDEIELLRSRLGWCLRRLHPSWEPYVKGWDPFSSSKGAATDPIQIAKDCGAKVYPCDGEVVFFRDQFHQFVGLLMAAAPHTASRISDDHTPSRIPAAAPPTHYRVRSAFGFPGRTTYETLDEAFAAADEIGGSVERIGEAERIP